MYFLSYSYQSSLWQRVSDVALERVIIIAGGRGALNRNLGNGVVNPFDLDVVDSARQLQVVGGLERVLAHVLDYHVDVQTLLGAQQVLVYTPAKKTSKYSL